MRLRSFMSLPETIISHYARLHLAKELDVKPGDLDYIGPQEGRGYILIMFTVMKPGAFLHGTTRSVRVDLCEADSHSG